MQKDKNLRSLYRKMLYKVLNREQHAYIYSLYYC